MPLFVSYGKIWFLGLIAHDLCGHITTHNPGGQVTTKASVLVDGELVENEWPFTVQLIPRKKLFADGTYQRPPQQAFIDRLVRNFDPTVVGTLDVSARPHGQFAILDGQQRNEVLGKVAYVHVWCAVYENMKVADEARFFYKRNKDRKSMHPYYQFNARVQFRDNKAVAILRIVTAEDFKLHINAKPDDHISAIKAVEDAYGYSSPNRRESLSPALRTIRMAMFGRISAKDGEMIRGLARFFQPFADEEIDMLHLRDVLDRAGGPANIIGMAKDKKAGSRHGHSAGYEIAHVIATRYNHGFKGQKLVLRRIDPRLR